MNLFTESSAEATLATPKSFTDIRQKWKALAADRKITSYDIAALCIYRAIVCGEGKEGAIKRLNKSFTPITNIAKLQNGAYTHFGLHFALLHIARSIKYPSQHAPVFLTWLTVDENRQMHAIATSIDASGKDVK